MARKVLPEDYRANTQVTFALSQGEREALAAEANRLKLTRAELMRGVLFGTYSVKDAIANTKSGKTCIIHLNLTVDERRLMDDTAYEYKISLSKLIRGTFYEII